MAYDNEFPDFFAGRFPSSDTTSEAQTDSQPDVEVPKRRRNVSGNLGMVIILAATVTIGAKFAASDTVNLAVDRITSVFDKDKSINHGSDNTEIAAQRKQIVATTLGPKTCEVTIPSGGSPYSVAQDVRHKAAEATDGVYLGELDEMKSDIAEQNTHFDANDVVYVPEWYCKVVTGDPSATEFPALG